MRLWDIANARILKTYTSHKNTQYAGTGILVFRTSRTCVACGSEDRLVYVWDVQTKRVVCKLAAHRDAVICVAVRMH